MLTIGGKRGRGAGQLTTAPTDFPARRTGSVQGSLSKADPGGDVYNLITPRHLAYVFVQPRRPSTGPIVRWERGGPCSASRSGIPPSALWIASNSDSMSMWVRSHRSTESGSAWLSKKWSWR